MKIVLDNISLDVIISRKNIKNIYFRVKEDLKLYISCNRLCSDTYIEKLIIKNKKDIIKMYNEQLKNTRLNDNVYYLGNKINYIYDKRIKLEDNIVYGPSIESINDYLEKNSLKVFESRLKNLQIMFEDLPKFRLRTRKMKTRWGVCNKGSMTVTLNTLLIHKDVTLIDYVIIHELCHFRYMNHSLSFWKEVEKYYPYYKLARKKLKND